MKCVSVRDRLNKNTSEGTMTDIEKTAWGEGPWQQEPDRAEWEHAGLPCLAIRHPFFGHWCGYVGVPPSHAYYGKETDIPQVDVHGGLTYAKAAKAGDVCYVA